MTKSKGYFNPNLFVDNSAWGTLSMQDKASMMEVAVRNGITNLADIRKKYNEFAEGGDKDTLTPWKALENIDYIEVPDTSFTREKTGAGSIEVMFKDTPKEGYEYGTGYKYPHPMPGHNVVIYNPKDNDAQDIRLDALHIMPQDATYDALRSELAYYADNSDIANNARGRMEDDIKQYGHPIPGMTYQDYYNNEVDGFLRNMFIEGSPEYIASKRYYPNQQQLREWNKELMPYVDRIHNYLLTGQRPATVLPEIVVTGKKHSIGGPLVDALLNEYAKGGGIHIKPSHRGRLTELKKRTGKSEAELYRTGSAATRKMITFARNARKWKHGEGGNLYDGESQDSQQLVIGRNYWQQQAAQPQRDYLAEMVEYNRKKEAERQQRAAALKRELAVRGEQIAKKKKQKEYLTMSNDNTWVERNNGREKNPHLTDRAVEGAKAHAAWAEEHPVMNAIGLGLGAAPLAVAAIPAVGAAIESAPAVTSALAPGSAFWMNPLTQQVVAGTAMSEGINLVTKAATHTANAVAPNLFAPADTWGNLVANGVEDITGWNPYGSAWTAWIPEATNPGWFMNPSRVMNPVGKIGNAVEETGRGIADNYFFLKHPNSYTRGIGGEAGLQDLIESGVVRGNPIGTEMSAHGFAKAYRKNRNHFRDIMDATGREGIAQRYYNRTLTEEDFNAIKEAANPYIKEWSTATKPKNERFQIALGRANPDPLSEYADWGAYQAQLASDRLSLKNATSLDDSGQPLAYFYDDGRNPLTAGYDYAASKYGVRINNASDYNPRIFPGHVHYSMPEAVSLSDPNVEVFKKGMFGITRKMDKSKLLQNTNSKIDNSVLDFGNIEDGTFNFTGYKESPFQMHLKRAEAKGYDVSDIKVIDLTKDSPERTEYINNSGLVGSFDEKLQMLIDRINKGGGAGNPKGTRYILHTNPDNLDARLSHELNHLLHIPDEPVPKGTVYGGWMNIFGDYFKRFNNTDIAARLRQIRDYYGQTGKEPLTEPMLKYARNHYENDTGLKNRVQEMLWNTGDLKGLAEWGNKHATGLLPFGFIGPYYLNNE